MSESSRIEGYRFRRPSSFLCRRRPWILDPAKDPVRLEVMERDAGEVRMRAFQDDHQFFLYLDLAGSGRHHCTCRDFTPWSLFSRRTRASDVFCRHIVAAAVKEDRLELLLSALTQSY